MPDIVPGMGEIDLMLRKYDGRPHRHSRPRRLGEDEYGIWLGSPTGTTVTFSYGGKPPIHTRDDAVRLITPGSWWCAVFFAEPSEREVYCDVIAPARWESPTELTLVDLDLDLVRFRDGRVRLDDEDEFEANIVAYGYPDEVVAQARAAAAELHAALTADAEPFASHWRKWMERV
jgi:uncharacterized protein